MSIADQYLARAVECEELAKNATNPERKGNFEEAARQWRNIADIHERLLAKIDDEPRRPGYLGESA
jgi:hypothetical protein